MIHLMVLRYPSRQNRVFVVQSTMISLWLKSLTTTVTSLFRVWSVKCSGRMMQVSNNGCCRILHANSPGLIDLSWVRDDSVNIADHMAVLRQRTSFLFNAIIRVAHFSLRNSSLSAPHGQSSTCSCYVLLVCTGTGPWGAGCKDLVTVTGKPSSR